MSEWSRNRKQEIKELKRQIASFHQDSDNDMLSLKVNELSRLQKQYQEITNQYSTLNGQIDTLQHIIQSIRIKITNCESAIVIYQEKIRLRGGQ